MNTQHYPDHKRRSQILNLIALGALFAWGACGADRIPGEKEESVGTVRSALLTAREDQYFASTSPKVMAGSLFGDTLSMSGDGTKALVGHPVYGSVELYKRASAGWVQEESFVARPFQPHSNFRSAGAISRSGKTLIVGSQYPFTDWGWVQIYEYRSTGGMPATWQRTASLALSGSGDKYFGYAVAVSANGEVAAVGNPGWGAGHPGDVRLYQRTEKDGIISWIPAGTLTAPLYLWNFGSSVALSDDGRSLVADAEFAATPADGPCASAYLYDMAGGLSRLREYHLLPLDTVSGRENDSVVSISGDGSTVLVGVPGRERLGSSSVPTGRGAAYVFERSVATGAWSQRAKLTSSDLEFDEFGASVAISADGQRCLIGAPYEGDGTQRYGATYLFARESGTWREQTKMRASNKVNGALYGSAVAMDTAGQRAMVAAPSWVGTGQPFVYSLSLLRSNGDACSANSECISGFCTDGFCCDQACGEGNDSDCQVCSKAKGATSDGRCTLRSAAIVCRPAVGDCDVAELCTGTSPTCPTDARALNTTVCRPAAGPCDLPEFCDGSSARCPRKDVKRKKGDICRKAAGPCDAAEECNGSDNTCPDDTKKPSGTICRESVGICDVEEYCTGTSDACPDNKFVLKGKRCGGGTHPTCDPGDTCDGAGKCEDNSAANKTPCKLSTGDAGQCKQATRTCEP